VRRVRGRCAARGAPLPHHPAPPDRTHARPEPPPPPAQEPLLAGCRLLELFRTPAALCCRAAAFYFTPDGRVGAARLHAVLHGRDCALPPALYARQRLT